MNITDSLGVLKMELTQNLVPQIVDLLTAALAEGRPIHEVENGLWDLALQVGRRGLGVFLIKDRMERAGMHWTLTGAQSMLDLRSVWIGGDWQAFQQQRIEHETERLYPHRTLVAGEAFFALAV